MIRALIVALFASLALAGCSSDKPDPVLNQPREAGAARPAPPNVGGATNTKAAEIPD